MHIGGLGMGIWVSQLAMLNHHDFVLFAFVLM